MVIEQNIRSKRRIPAFFLGLYMACSPFQFSSGNFGTILAFSTMVLFFMSDITNNHSKNILRIDTVAVLLLGLTTFLATTLRVQNVPYKIYAQFLFFIFVSMRTYKESELDYALSLFTLGLTLFAVMLAYSCNFLNVYRNFHGSITIWGTSYNPNHIGIPVIFLYCIMLYNIINRKKVVISLIIAVLAIYCLFLTASRGSFLTAGIITFYAMFVGSKAYKGRYGYFGLFISLIVIIFMVYLLVQQSKLFRAWERMMNISAETDSGRLSIWNNTLSRFMEAPLFGHGYNSYFFNSGNAVHNTYVQLLYENGIVGTLCFIYLLIVQFKRERWRKSILGQMMLLTIVCRSMLLSGLDNRVFWAVLSWLSIWREPNVNKIDNIINIKPI